MLQLKSIKKLIILLIFFAVQIDSVSFSIENNGVVKDNATGLIWQRCSKGQNNDTTCSGNASDINWDDSIEYCLNLNLADRKWRLPTVNELKSILDLSKESSPTINSTAFPSTGTNDPYWTSTTNANSSGNAWVIYFDGGSSDSNEFKVATKYVRCVSGP